MNSNLIFLLKNVKYIIQICFSLLICRYPWKLTPGWWCLSSLVQLSNLRIKLAITRVIILPSIGSFSYIWLPPSVLPMCKFRESIHVISVTLIRKNLQCSSHVILGGHGVFPKPKVTLLRIYYAMLLLWKEFCYSDLVFIWMCFELLIDPLFYY